MRLFMLLLAACADDAVTCGENTTLTDGVCIAEPAPEPEPPTVGGLLDDLFPCTPAEGEGRIDLAAGCVDELCLGGRTPADADCSQPIADYPDYWTCTLQPGITSYWFEGPDPRRGLAIDRLILRAPYNGTTVDGLGIGVASGCFVRSFGEPRSFSLAEDKSGWRLTSAEWAGIEISDGDGFVPPDGDVDAIWLEAQSGGS